MATPSVRSQTSTVVMIAETAALRFVMGQTHPHGWGKGGLCVSRHEMPGKQASWLPTGGNSKKRTVSFASTRPRATGWTTVSSPSPCSGSTSTCSSRHSTYVVSGHAPVAGLKGLLLSSARSRSFCLHVAKRNRSSPEQRRRKKGGRTLGSYVFRLEWSPLVDVHLPGVRVTSSCRMAAHAHPCSLRSHWVLPTILSTACSKDVCTLHSVTLRSVNEPVQLRNDVPPLLASAHTPQPDCAWFLGPGDPIDQT